MTDENAILTEKEEDSLRAAELVLGLLPADEAMQMHRGTVGNNDLSADIAFWEERLARMAEDLHPVRPPQSVWHHIESALDGTLPVARKKTASRVHPSIIQISLWENIALWRGVSFAGVGAAIVLSIVAFLLFWQSSTLLTEQGGLVAALQAVEGQTAVFVATYDPQREKIIIVPTQVMHETKRVPELWLVTKDKRVISLGVIAPENAQAVVIPPDLVHDTSAGAGLVITLEPPGGAPDGVATGPAIAQGELSPI